MDAHLTEPTEARKVGRQKRPRKPPRVASAISGNGWLIQRSILTICPWAADSFRGRRHAFLSQLPRVVTWPAVQHWRAGRRNVPPDVALALANLHRQRAQAELQHACDLEYYAKTEMAKPRRLSGFMAGRAS